MKPEKIIVMGVTVFLILIDIRPAGLTEIVLQSNKSSTLMKSNIREMGTKKGCQSRAALIFFHFHLSIQDILLEAYSLRYDEAGG